MQVQSSPELGIMPRLLSAALGLGIILLAAANGFFTYSGAMLYIEGQEYALLFAIAVQFAIAATLLALPFVRGLGKPVLILVYAAALGLSALSAYTYIYNAAQPGEIHDNQLDASRQSKLAQTLSSAIQDERDHLNAQQQAMEKLRRSTEEEATAGLLSGMGPGKGKEYYRKLEEYETLRTRYDQDAARVDEAATVFREFNSRLSSPAESLTPQAALAALTHFHSLLKSSKAQTAVQTVMNTDLGRQPTPIEKAILSLKNISSYDINTLVSIVWASVFDLLALFLGIIRYNLLKVSKSLLSRLYDATLEVSTFAHRLGHLREESRARYRSQLNTHSLPLNSTEMQNFATQLLAGSQLAVNQESPDASEPIRRLIQYIEPLYSEKQTDLVGIPWDNISDEARLAPLVAMLVQNHVLLNEPRMEAYILNSSSDCAQKVLVLMRLGMTEPPESMAGVDFLLGENATSMVASRA